MKAVILALAIFGASMVSHAGEVVTCKFNGSTIKASVDDAGAVTYKIGRSAVKKGLRVVGPEVYNKFELKEMIEMNGINYAELADYKEIILEKTVETTSLVILKMTDASEQTYLRGGGMLARCE
ncbi:hypothetical protein [Bdellovibrio sp. HCB288]|uniref:hypothetical protein n=1 Tax=Bdellovibrio sp. HCB288 TaxID=3394355 RepID=UPI0039B6C0EF